MSGLRRLRRSVAKANNTIGSTGKLRGHRNIERRDRLAKFAETQGPKFLESGGFNNIRQWLQYLGLGGRGKP